ncbi:hypothetical protein BU15DRAFT_65812 [Melanogaster broomeanus]|nr:hypothetical protein BU15DRAFT_65812 [Melanogaster broomeanus]
MPSMIDPFNQWIVVPDDRPTLPPVDDEVNGLKDITSLRNSSDLYINGQYVGRNKGLLLDQDIFSSEHSDPDTFEPIAESHLSPHLNPSQTLTLWDTDDQCGNSLEDVPSQVQHVMPEDLACTPRMLLESLRSCDVSLPPICVAPPTPVPAGTLARDTSYTVGVLFSATIRFPSAVVIAAEPSPVVEQLTAPSGNLLGKRRRVDSLDDDDAPPPKISKRSKAAKADEAEYRPSAREGGIVETRRFIWRWFTLWELA